MRIILIVTLSFIYSCSTSPENDGPIDCLESIMGNELVLNQSEIDSTISLFAPNSWLTEFIFIPESSSVISSDTAKELGHKFVVIKTSFHNPPKELDEFYHASLLFLEEDIGIKIFDSGVYNLQETQIQWIKYNNPSDTIMNSNTSLEFFYAGINRIENFKILVYGDEKIEERICEGYQIFLANK